MSSGAQSFPSRKHWEPVSSKFWRTIDKVVGSIISIIRKLILVEIKIADYMLVETLHSNLICWSCRIKQIEEREERTVPGVVINIRSEIYRCGLSQLFSPLSSGPVAPTHYEN